MSRFDCDGEGGIPWELWETIVSNALGGRRGQQALAAMEEALLALPERKLIYGRLAYSGSVCAVGALVAYQLAQEGGVDIASIIDVMGAGVKCWCGHGRQAHTGEVCSGKRWNDTPCSCTGYEPDVSEDYSETVEAGKRAGLSGTVAWHLAYLNDETYAAANDEERYEQILVWVRRAQGKEAVAA